MSDAPRRPDRILIAIIAAIAVLVAVALAVVFTRGEPEALDESTPAGVVQRYSTAVIEGDASTADSYLTEEARALCRGSYSSGAPLPARVVLISTTERDTSAVVRVSVVSSGAGGPFGPSEYEMEDRFSLVKTAGTWKINQAPYPLLSCTGPAVKP
jgi:hypothetical protein